MKWQTLALAFLSSTGLASPISERDASNIYTLRLVSKTPSLNGKYLGVNGTLVGVYKDAPGAVRFYPVPSKEGSAYELHTYPVGKIDRALALVGAEAYGLMDFADVTNPAATTVPTGFKFDWDSFTLDKKDKTVNYAGSTGGRWVAFPSGSSSGEWSVKWKDASAITIETYMPVTVVYEEFAPAKPE